MSKLTKTLYQISAAYLGIRIATGLATHFGSGAVHDFAWDINDLVLNNLGILILLIFGVANGLFLSSKLNGKPSSIITIICLFAGVIGTALGFGAIYLGLFALFWP